SGRSRARSGTGVPPRGCPRRSTPSCWSLVSLAALSSWLPRFCKSFRPRERARATSIRGIRPPAYAGLGPDAVTLCAEAHAAWRTSWLNALGVRWARRDGVWRALDPPPHIYLAGITLEAGVPSQALVDVPGSVGDAWHALDLSPYGFSVWRTEPWF